MKSGIVRAAAAALLSFAGFAVAAPQLLVPGGAGDAKSSAAWSSAPSVQVPGFFTPGIQARFNASALLMLKHGDALELTLPDSSRHPFVLDLVESHSDGIRTLFARHQDHGNKHRVIVTTGATGSFGIFSTPQGDYRLVPGPAGDVLIDMGAEQQFLPPMPKENDVRISPVEQAKAAAAQSPQMYVPLAGINSLPMTKAAPATGNIVDIMFVITPGLATNLGADLLTRLQFLVARANASYADSDVAIRLRYVHHTVLAAYSDATDTGVALSEISPGCVGAPGHCDAAFNAGVFGGIEALRTTHGADVVAMLLNGSNSGGNGIAWLGSRNGASTTITNPLYLYSATTGCVRGCESVFIHEVGHNFGLNHDRATWAWQGGGVANPPGTQYNFGYYFCQTGALRCNPNLAPGSGGCAAGTQPECSDFAAPSANNFADLMAYFHQSTETNYRFSNPLVQCFGNRAAGGTSAACGAADADASRYLNEVRAALSAVKASTGGKPDTYTDGSSSVTGWPPGGTLPAGFTSSGNAWTVATDRVFEGTHSLRSAQVFGTSNSVPVTNMASFANSDLAFTGTFTAGTLSFMYQVSSWATQGLGSGFIEFSVDGVVVLSDTGESGWQFFSYPITAGAHTLQWRFKNARTFSCAPSGPGGANCADRAWIDAVSLPVATVASSTALVSSVNPSSAGQSVTLTATVSGGSGTPTGTVTFQNGGVDMAGCVALVLSGGGTAACITSALPPGANSIVANYSGNATYSGSSSTSLIQTVNVGAQLFTANPAILAFGGQSMNTTSPSMTSTITNTPGASRTITGIAATTGYTVNHNCPVTPMAAGATCTITVTFTPPVGAVTGPHNGVVSINYAGGGPTVVNLTGTAEKTLVTHYYRSILRRAPDSGGKTFWEGEASRIAGLGVSVNEAWFSMAQAFYFSPEYAAFNATNTAFITDLYNTFFNRAPDGAGLTFWTGQLTSGLPREVALASFMFSAEFVGFTNAIFGSPTARAEVNAIGDFYRGLLSRPPDTGGFNFWVGRFRTAQCAGAGATAAVTNEVEAISSAFALSAEYVARARNSSQYVGDLYNAFLRRGGDLAGVQFWIGQVPPGPQTREQVRVQFKNSAEFQARVAAIIAQGCLP